MSLNELTPTEVLTIYLMNKSKLDRYEDILKTGEIVEDLAVTESTVMSTRYVLTEEALDKLRESKHYKFTIDLDQKLFPIASVIMDVEKDLYQEIIDSFKETL
jgi:cell division protein FtsX